MHIIIFKGNIHTFYQILKGILCLCLLSVPAFQDHAKDTLCLLEATRGEAKTLLIPLKSSLSWHLNIYLHMRVSLLHTKYCAYGTKWKE